MGAKLKEGDKAPDFTAVDFRDEKFNLKDFRGDRSVALVFLRYVGCALCQYALAELKSKYNLFLRNGAELIVFVQSPKKTLSEQGDAGVFPFRIVPDPDGVFYELYGIGSGSVLDMLSPQTISSGVKALLKGHKQGKMEGNQWQLPGEFIVDKSGILKFIHIGKNISDRTSADDLLASL